MKDYICISSAHNRNNSRQLYSPSEWFKDAEYFSLTEEEGDVLIITKRYLEVPSNAIRNIKKYIGEGGFQTTKVSSLPLGKFFFDEEESTEDELVIYCS